MDTRELWWMVALLVMLHSTSLFASDAPVINVNVGRVGVFDASAPWRYGIEYRNSPIGKWGITPAIGIARTENDSNYLYLEAKKDYRLSTAWILTPSLGIGRLGGRGGVRLGHKIEFRSGIELAYRFSNDHRIGVAIYHLSNGGISERNPGTEEIVLSLSIQIGDR